MLVTEVSPMDRCLTLGALTVAILIVVVVALLADMWLIALGVVIAFLMWFWRMSHVM
jgi:hypothetical protein